MLGYDCQQCHFLNLNLILQNNEEEDQCQCVPFQKLWVHLNSNLLAHNSVKRLELVPKSILSVVLLSES